MRALLYEAKVAVPSGSAAWKDLIPEIPVNTTLLEADIFLKPGQQWASLLYFQPTGKGRKARQRVSLTSRQAVALLAKAYPRNPRVKNFTDLIPDE